jgi:hypothetical protein
VVRGPFAELTAKGRSKTPDIHVVKSIITAKITPKTVPAANSINEIAAGADG